MNELLTAAVEDAKRRIIEAGDRAGTQSEHYTENFHGGKNEVETVVRLDWEFPEPEVKDYSREELMNLLFSHVYQDLEDLIEDGDVNEPHDPLLRLMDGSKKTGRKPAFIDITNIGLYPQYSWRKDTMEYTVFLRLYVVWE